LCLTCIDKEKRHKDYQAAADAELEAVKRGERNYPGIGLPEDLKPKKMLFSLFIRRYNRNLQFDTLPALRNGLSKYFSYSELEKGIVEKLTTFNVKVFGESYYKNNYQDIDVYYYPEEEEK